MRITTSISKICLSLGIVAALGLGSAFGQGAKNAHFVPVPNGAKQKLQGVISTRDNDTFKMRNPGGAETIVVLSPTTKVSTHNKFGGKDSYSMTYLMRGLRVQVQGVGNSDGHLVADWVRFNEKDLRNAQAVEDTNELAEENAARIAEAEATAKKLAAQIEETNTLAMEANAKAEAAQKTADQAFKDAAMANARINGLDSYDVLKTVVVLFPVGSSTLNSDGKKSLDEAAAWAKGEKDKGNTNGWLVEVVGFADTTGNTAKNRTLSSKRAKTVIDYLVLQYNLDLRRLVQPFGYGDSKPIASNKTAGGRAQNRRVEVRILQNKGIANKLN